MARISNPKSFAGNRPLATVYQVENLLKGSGSLGAYGYVPLDANGKIDASYVPQVTITDTFVGSSTDIAAAGEGGTGGTFQQYLNSLVTTGAIPSGGSASIKAEKGDLVNITDGDNKGTYVITGVSSGVASYLALTVGTGYVTTINGKSATNGSITLNLSDINDVDSTLATLLKSAEVKSGTGNVSRVFIDSKELALLSDIPTLSGVTGQISVLETKVDGLIDAVTTINGNVSTVNNNVSAIHTALDQTAVQITSGSFTWAETNATSQTVDGVSMKVYSKEVDGQVLQVYDANEWCYPSVAYNSTTKKSTISVVMETTDTLAETWTYYAASVIDIADLSTLSTATIPAKISSSSSSTSSSSSSGE